MRYIADEVVAARSTVSAANVEADLNDALLRLEDADVDVEEDVDPQAFWIMNPRTKRFLRTLKNANGAHIYKAEMTEQGTIEGVPFVTTTAIPKNLGSGGNESEITLTCSLYNYILEKGRLTISTHPNATYYDGTKLVSGLSTNRTVIKGMARHDFYSTQSAATTIITGVTWAPGQV